MVLNQGIICIWTFFTVVLQTGTEINSQKSQQEAKYNHRLETIGFGLGFMKDLSCLEFE